jgi:alkane 1-monooxygenase
MRRYQSLRHFEKLPQLPNGYVGMFLACYIPPLWFRLMDPRVVAWAEGNASRIHFQAGRKAALVRRHGLRDEHTLEAA